MRRFRFDWINERWLLFGKSSRIQSIQMSVSSLTCAAQSGRGKRRNESIRKIMEQREISGLERGKCFLYFVSL